MKTDTNEEQSYPVIFKDITDHETALKQIINLDQLAAIRPGIASIEAECDVMEARAESDAESSRSLVMQINAKRKLCTIMRDVLPAAEALNEAKPAGEHARQEVARLNAEMEALTAEASALELRDIRGWNGEVPCVDPLEQEIQNIKHLFEWKDTGTEKDFREKLKNAAWYGGIPSRQGAKDRMEYLSAQIPVTKAAEEALMERIKNQLSEAEINRLNSIRFRISQINEELVNATDLMSKLNATEEALLSSFQSHLEAARIRASGVVEALQIRTQTLHLESK